MIVICAPGEPVTAFCEHSVRVCKGDTKVLLDEVVILSEVDSVQDSFLPDLNLQFLCKLRKRGKVVAAMLVFKTRQSLELF